MILLLFLFDNEILCQLNLYITWKFLFNEFFYLRILKRSFNLHVTQKKKHLCRGTGTTTSNLLDGLNINTHYQIVDINVR